MGRQHAVVAGPDWVGRRAPFRRCIFVQGGFPLRLGDIEYLYDMVTVWYGMVQ